MRKVARLLDQLIDSALDKLRCRSSLQTEKCIEHQILSALMLVGTLGTDIAVSSATGGVSESVCSV
jgi:hypothetical protein